MNEEISQIFEIIKENASKNKIVYETEEGMFAEEISDFVDKDIPDLLNSLGIDLYEIMKRAETDDSRFVNDMALVNLLCFFKENWKPNYVKS